MPERGGAPPAQPVDRRGRQRRNRCDEERAEAMFRDGGEGGVPAESSWVTYLLLILVAALAAASAMWFFSRMTSVFARRAVNPRMHMSNS
jgi:hypothetical protein